MKQFLLLSAAALLSAGAMAQTRGTNESPVSSEWIQRAKPDLNDGRLKTRITESRWLNASDDYEFFINGGGSYPDPPVRSSALMPIFPDTTIIYGFDDTGAPVGVFIHAAATMIEPLSMLNTTEQPWIVPGVDYRLDSTALRYAYVRNTDPSIVDTLRLTFIKDIPGNLWDQGGWIYQDIQWDATNREVLASNVLMQMDHLLTENDSTTRFEDGTMNLDLLAWESAINNLEGKRIGVVVTFHPGYQWVPFQAGSTNADSLFGKNSFWLLSFENGGENTDQVNLGDPVTRNTSYILTSDVLYNTSTTGWNGFMMPAIAFATSYAFEDHAIYFKVTTDQVGINEVENEFASLSVFPNPASTAVKVSFELKHAVSDVNLSITDVLGRTIMSIDGGSRAIGRHDVALDVANLANGVYNCTMKSGNQSVSTKVIVAH
jgi:hypothetical protein